MRSPKEGPRNCEKEGLEVFIYVPLLRGMGSPQNLFQLIVAGIGIIIIVGAILYIVYLLNEILVGYPITELLFHNCGYHYGRGVVVFRVWTTIVAVAVEAALIVWLSSITI